jgi:hypothetical protein
MHSGVPETIEYPRFTSSDYAYRQMDSVALNDEDGNRLWGEHPIKRSGMDVGAIEVPLRNERGFVLPIEYQFNGLQYSQKPRCEMASQLSILGFPISNRPTGFFPIWVQATVASEMDLGYDGKRGFLVDALTSHGMSGAPVFAHDAESGWIFMGVYSGRIREGEVDLPLGIVWKREAVCETILRLALPNHFS